MRIFRRLIIILCGVVAGVASPVYTVTDLGSLGGNTTAAFAVSASGEAAGWAVDPLGDTEALLFGGASPANLLAGSSWLEGEATGINSSGQVSGTVWSNGTSHGVIWSGGSTVDLGPNTSASAINDAGQVAGSGNDAFLYQNGARTDLGTLAGGSWTVAEGLSGNGDVTGYGQTASGVRGFLWTAGGGLLQLSTLGGNNSYGMAVNDSGVVAGSAAAGTGYLHATSWLGGTAADLGTLGGGNSYAYGINDAGAIVGYSWIFGNATTHAFIDLNGVMVDLNSLLTPAESGWTITAAYGINDQGQIVGEALYDGQSHAVLLNDPPAAPAGGGTSGNASAAPEPVTWILVGGALVLGGALRRALTRPR
jgi:probable HAF family extracellular repeat protein